MTEKRDEEEGYHGPSLEAVARSSAKYAALGPEGQAKLRGGGKLTRTQTITVRVDERLNYLLELAARATRRTKSSYVEQAVEESLMTVVATTQDLDGEEYQPSIHQLAKKLWDPDETRRVLALAWHARDLMSIEEQQIWRLIKDNGYFWMGHYSGTAAADGKEVYFYFRTQTNLIMHRVHDNWELIKDVAAGRRPKEDMPKWVKERRSPFDVNDEAFVRAMTERRATTFETASDGLPNWNLSTDLPREGGSPPDEPTSDDDAEGEE